jgi:hypothetical protein
MMATIAKAATNGVKYRAVGPNMTSTMLALQFGMRNEIMQNAIFNRIIEGMTDFMQEMAPELITTFQKEYENRRLWMLRNKPGGYERSTAALNALMKQISDRIALVDKSFVARGLTRFLEKITAAGAVLYLRIS